MVVLFCPPSGCGRFPPHSKRDSAQCRCGACRPAFRKNTRMSDRATRRVLLKALGTAAGAQEAAKACHEMSSLALELQNLVGQFKLSGDGHGSRRDQPALGRFRYCGASKVKSWHHVAHVRVPDPSGASKNCPRFIRDRQARPTEGLPGSTLPSPRQDPRYRHGVAAPASPGTSQIGCL